MDIDKPKETEKKSGESWQQWLRKTWGQNVDHLCTSQMKRWDPRIVISPMKVPVLKRGRVGFQFNESCDLESWTP